MSIPLLWFLFAWLFLIAIFAFMAFLTIAMTLRFGLSCAATYIYAGLFTLVSAVVLVGMSSYILQIDWSQMVNLLSSTPIGI